MATKSKVEQRTRRHIRIRAKVVGTLERPRLAVFRSNRTVYAQLIDDTAGKTLAAADARTLKEKGARVQGRKLGALMAEKAKKLGIEKVVFDRGGFLFTGTIREVAEGAREAGLSL